MDPKAIGRRTLNNPLLFPLQAIKSSQALFGSLMERITFASNGEQHSQTAISSHDLVCGFISSDTHFFPICKNEPRVGK
jgi:hypothetical protein